LSRSWDLFKAKRERISELNRNANSRALEGLQRVAGMPVDLPEGSGTSRYVENVEALGRSQLETK